MPTHVSLETATDQDGDEDDDADEEEDAHRRPDDDGQGYGGAVEERGPAGVVGGAVVKDEHAAVFLE